MSETAEVAPHWTLGWRLQRSLAWAGVSVEEMARELDVSRSTISRWCHDQGAPPRSIYLRAWAHKCRTPYNWLIHGDDEWAARDSNSEPMDSSSISTAELKSEFLRNIGQPIEASRRTGRPRIQAGVA